MSALLEEWSPMTSADLGSHPRRGARRVSTRVTHFPDGSTLIPTLGPFFDPLSNSGSGGDFRLYKNSPIFEHGWRCTFGGSTRRSRCEKSTRAIHTWVPPALRQVSHATRNFSALMVAKSIKDALAARLHHGSPTPASGAGDGEELGLSVSNGQHRNATLRRASLPTIRTALGPQNGKPAGTRHLSTAPNDGLVLASKRLPSPGDVNLRGPTCLDRVQAAGRPEAPQRHPHRDAALSRDRRRSPNRIGRRAARCFDLLNCGPAFVVRSAGGLPFTSILSKSIYRTEVTPC
jgi:hypothetical protein